MGLAAAAVCVCAVMRLDWYWLTSWRVPEGTWAVVCVTVTLARLLLAGGACEPNVAMRVGLGA